MRKLWKNGLPALVLLVFGIVLSGCDNGTTSSAGGTKNNAQALADQLDKLITNGGSALSGTEADVVRLDGSSTIQLRATSTARKIEKTITIPKGVTLELGEDAASLTLEGADTVGDGNAEFIFTITGGGTLFLSKAGSLTLSGAGTKLFVDGGITAKFGTNDDGGAIAVANGPDLDEDLTWGKGITFQVYAPTVPGPSSADGSFTDSSGAIPGKRPAGGPNLILGAPDMIYADDGSNAIPFTFKPIDGNTYGNVTMKGIVDNTTTDYGGYVAGIDSDGLALETTFGDIIVDQYTNFAGSTAADTDKLVLGNITVRNKGKLAPAGNFAQVPKITIEDTGVFEIAADFTANEIEIKKGGKLQIGISATTLSVSTLSNAGTISALKNGTLTADGSITVLSGGKVTNSGKIELGSATSIAASVLTITKATLTNTGTIKLAGVLSGLTTAQFGGKIVLNKEAVIDNKAGGILDLGQPKTFTDAADTTIHQYATSITFNDADDETGSKIKFAPGSELHGIWISGSGSAAASELESIGFYSWTSTADPKWAEAVITVDLDDDSDTAISRFNGFVGKSPVGNPPVDVNTALGITAGVTLSAADNSTIGCVRVSGSEVVLRATSADATLNGVEVRYNYSE